MEGKTQPPSGKEAGTLRVDLLSHKSEQRREPAWLRQLRIAQAQEQSRQQ